MDSSADCGSVAFTIGEERDLREEKKDFVQIKIHHFIFVIACLLQGTTARNLD